mmetsp:Transcript_24788/g.69605  ORF Transcript_24788/g.69605 Transcript_24788/m.69605 type:complete len:99 (-) Transcript_24788:280-576(-)|eukprot:CAMPEP_0119563790 /NCGR_PEP_ID=MMETSP1352-20130426/24738_1 /TAXON_ID=265584 /ORGANISM="Stauroneis constricta, Strain CCMP1120" /LENGTH=98 /DNA_ID=CAMNT_0007612459 /DNA_START=14 /DNA_END=310 /DNA_ORIENTATION=-
MKTTSLMMIAFACVVAAASAENNNNLRGAAANDRKLFDLDMNLDISSTMDQSNTHEKEMTNTGISDLTVNADPLPEFIEGNIEQIVVPNAVGDDGDDP